MQISMWVILGATVALAAVISNVRKQSFTIALAPELALRDVAVRLPQGWSVQKIADETSRTVFVATENRKGIDSAGPRTISVLVQPPARGCESFVRSVFQCHACGTGIGARCDAPDLSVRREDLGK